MLLGNTKPHLRNSHFSTIFSIEMHTKSFEVKGCLRSSGKRQLHDLNPTSCLGILGVFEHFSTQVTECGMLLSQTTLLRRLFQAYQHARESSGTHSSYFPLLL